ncbi:MAG: SLC13 family permease, partial [Lactobacillus panisapium]|nr:SLC13 family permease [Lactobacillus panisapium]
MALYITSIIVAIVLLVFLIFKGVNMIPASLIASLAAILIGGVDLWKGLSQGYGVTMGNYVKDFFLIFFLSALFGAVMSDSGAASKIASTLVNKIGENSVILVLLVVTLILSYGGIMTYLVAFTLYPIAVILFKEADIPIKLFPATILGIAATICMTTLPGSPQIQNIMPTQYFHTNIYAGATIGIICGIYVFCANYLYLKYAKRKCAQKGEHYVNLDPENSGKNKQNSQNMNFWLAVLPIIVMLALIFILKNKFDANFSVVIAMFTANVLAFILFYKQLHDHIGETLETGTNNGINALMTTSAVVAFGGVATMSPQFANIVKLISN